MIDLKRLESFVTVAESGHLGRAAERLHISQPALSRRIQELERQLGFILFEHVGRGLRLSEQGRGFLDDCRELLNRARSLEQHARGYASGERGVITLGATPQMFERLMPGVLQAYRPAWPGVEIRLSEGSSRESLLRLQRGEIDFALIPLQAYEGLQSLRLPALEISAVAPPDHFPRLTPHLEIGELAGKPILALNQGFRSRQDFDAACRQARIEPRIVLESGAPQTLLALAAAGLGIAIVPETVQIFSQTLQVMPLTLDGQPLTIQVTLSWHHQRKLAPYTRHFIEVMTQVAQAQFGAT